MSEEQQKRLRVRAPNSQIKVAQPNLTAIHLHIAALCCRGISYLAIFFLGLISILVPLHAVYSLLLSGCFKPPSPFLHLFFILHESLISLPHPVFIPGPFSEEALTFSCSVASLLQRRRGLLGLCVGTLTHLHLITVVQ